MENLRSLIFEALGEASMCWDPIPKGVFDPDACVKVGDRLEDAIKKYLGDDINKHQTIALIPIKPGLLEE